MSARAFVVKSGWLAGEGRRLDASAYQVGGHHARERIMATWPWESLGKVAQLFNGPRFARHYVSEPDRGVPFLSSSDILKADLRWTPRLSKRRTPFIDRLVLQEGWTLISRSGTIGNTAYVRLETAGMTASEHVIRAAPKSAEVLPGYLYAFLSSAPAQAMIRQRTYGTVVQHVEPAQLADIPIPLMNAEVVRHVHDLVAAAGVGRTQAALLLDRACDWFDDQTGQRRYRDVDARALGVVASGDLAGRLDAFHHAGWAAEARLDGDRLGDLARVVATSRVPRIYADRGVPFLSGIDVFDVRPRVRVRLAKHIAVEFDALVHAGELAVQGSGQRYGLLGRAAYIGDRLDGWAASHDLFRVSAGQNEVAARIFTFLRSDVGHRAMLRHSYGTSIPHVNPAGIASVRIPQLPAELTADAVTALRLRDRADADEESAITEVERWLA